MTPTKRKNKRPKRKPGEYSIHVTFRDMKRKDIRQVGLMAKYYSFHQIGLVIGRSATTVSKIVRAYEFSRNGK